MPEIASLRRVRVGGETTVSFGDRLVFCYQDDDTAMRNLAIVALTDAGVEGLEVAKVFGITAPYVSRIRGEARRSGAEGLVKRRGRPPKLSARQVTTVRRLAAEGATHADIATRYGVARSVISELLAKFGPTPRQESLAPPSGGEASADDTPFDEATDDAPDDSAPVVGLARIATGEHPSRYAGAALLYPYLDMVGAGDVFSTLSGGRARRYDDLSVFATAVMGFALGIDTVEGSKHLRRADAGALVGVSAIPELRTLRERLSALADGSDPLALQRAFAKATLCADPPTSPVYYVDDHFVAYTGGGPWPRAGTPSAEGPGPAVTTPMSATSAAGPWCSPHRSPGDSARRCLRSCPSCERWSGPRRQSFSALTGAAPTPRRFGPAARRTWTGSPIGGAAWPRSKDAPNAAGTCAATGVWWPRSPTR
jgi:hypothetical protein